MVISKAAPGGYNVLQGKEIVKSPYWNVTVC